jgi:hypothetical protein
MLPKQEKGSEEWSCFKARLQLSRKRSLCLAALAAEARVEVPPQLFGSLEGHYKTARTKGL